MPTQPQKQLLFVLFQRKLLQVTLPKGMETLQTPQQHLVPQKEEVGVALGAQVIQRTRLQNQKTQASHCGPQAKTGQNAASTPTGHVPPAQKTHEVYLSLKKTSRPRPPPKSDSTLSEHGEPPPANEDSVGALETTSQSLATRSTPPDESAETPERRDDRQSQKSPDKGQHFLAEKIHKDDASTAQKLSPSQNQENAQERVRTPQTNQPQKNCQTTENLARATRPTTKKVPTQTLETPKGFPPQNAKIAPHLPQK